MKLVLIIDSMPDLFFINNELHYCDGFNTVDVFVNPYKITEKLQAINGVKWHLLNYRGNSKARMMLNAIAALFDVDVIKELFFLLRCGKVNMFTLKQVFAFWYNGKRESIMVHEVLKREGYKNSDHVLFYSYRLSYHALSCVRLLDYFTNSISIARCHGIDLFEYRQKYDYLPMRNFLLKKLANVFCISNDGYKYLIGRYPKPNAKIAVSYLGTKDHGVAEYVRDKSILRIVSCSRISPEKRIDHIIEAISGITNIKIHWTHIGGGSMESELLDMAAKHLNSNVSFCITGFISNNDVCRIYQTQQFDIFVNTSETEGLPVSIMEAASCGIPIAATDVGGTNEIVHHGENGYLLRSDNIPEELRRVFINVHNMSDSDYSAMRLAARSIWYENFNDERNYIEFYSDLKCSLSR